MCTWSASIAGKQCRRFARIDTRSGALVEGWNIFPAGKLPDLSHVFLTLRYTRIVLRCREAMAARLIRRQPPETGSHIRATRHRRSGLTCFPPSASSVPAGGR